jgi:hypothetical protein
MVFILLKGHFKGRKEVNFSDMDNVVARQGHDLGAIYAL